MAVINGDHCAVIREEIPIPRWDQLRFCVEPSNVVSPESPDYTSPMSVLKKLFPRDQRIRLTEKVKAAG